MLDDRALAHIKRELQQIEFDDSQDGQQASGHLPAMPSGHHERVSNLVHYSILST